MKKHFSWLLVATLFCGEPLLVAQETSESDETVELETTEESPQVNVSTCKNGEARSLTIGKGLFDDECNSNSWGWANGDGTASAYQAYNSALFCGGSFLGIHGDEVNEETVERLNLPGEYGAHVVKVVEESAAEKAGLQEDDVIVGYNGRRVESMAQLRRLITETPVGRTVALTIVRNGVKQEVNTELGTRPGVTLHSAAPFDSVPQLLSRIYPKDFDGSVPENVCKKREMLELHLNELDENLEDLDGSVPENVRKKREMLELHLNELDENLEDLDVLLFGPDNDETSHLACPKVFTRMRPKVFTRMRPKVFTRMRPKVFTRMLVNDGVRLGVTVQSLSPQLGRYFKLDEGQKGVLVSKVHDGFPAKEADIRAGDVIVTIDGEKIANPFDVRKEISDKEGTIEVHIIREGKSKTMYVDLKERDHNGNMGEDLFMMPENDSDPFLNSK
ncbi:MAG: PDZ domain-containing protein [Chlorobi bacterium]|nr:PDZ domain-containing protein [Chlorobiota bacterium]